MASAYFTPVTDLTALASLGAASPTVSYAEVKNIGPFAWTAGPLSADGVNIIAASGVSTTIGAWVALKFRTPASTTEAAGLNIPEGTTPTSPSNGDIWSTSSGLYARINGTTLGPIGSEFGAVVNLLAGDGNAAYNLSVGQAALDMGGIVTFVGSGLCPLPASTSYVINSNTTLYVDNRITITRVTGALGANLIQSSAVYRAANTGWSTVTFTWLGGLALKVTMPSHGFSVGQAVCCRGTVRTMPAQYFGTFDVTEVIDSSNFVVLLWRIPTGSPSGTAEILLADENIKIIGGTWNYGSYTRGVTAPSNFGVFGVFMAGVRNLEFDLLAGDSFSHVVTTAGVVDVKARIGGNTPGEIYKMYGPCKQLELLGIFGNSGDDVCSIQPYEPTAFAYLNFWGGGDCLDMQLHDLNGFSTDGEGAPGDGPGAHLYAHDWFYSDNIVFDNVSSPAAGTWSPIGLDTLETVGYAGNIVARNIRLGDTTSLDLNGGFVTVTNPIVIKRLSIESVSLPFDASQVSGGMASIVQVDAAASIGILSINGVVGAVLNTGHNPIRIAGSVQLLTVSEANVTPTGSGAIFVGIQSGATIGTIRLTDSYLGSFDSLVFLNSGISGTPLVQFRNVSSSCLNGARFDSSGNCDLEGGNIFASISSGVGQAIGAGVVMYIWASQSNTYPSGQLSSASSGATANERVYATLTGSELLTNKTLGATTLPNGGAITTAGELGIGVSSPSSLANGAIGGFDKNQNSPTQVVVRNQNAGSSATAEVVLSAAGNSGILGWAGSGGVGYGYLAVDYSVGPPRAFSFTFGPSNTFGFGNHAPAARQAITGALSAVTDANAKAVLTSILAAFTANGFATNSTT